MQFTGITKFMSRVGAIAAGGTIAMVAATGVAQANPAYNYVKPYRDYAVQAPGTNEVEASFTSTQPASNPLDPTSGQKGIASYGDALLTSKGTGLTTAQAAAQLFSDRLYPSGAPFNSGAADSTGVQMAVNDKTQTVSVSLVLYSWGNVTVRLKNLRVLDGMLVADGPGAGTGSPEALFAFALDEVNVPA
jgi:hypothetical protein